MAPFDWKIGTVARFVGIALVVPSLVLVEIWHWTPPVLLLTIFVQQEIVAGLTAGGVKA